MKRVIAAVAIVVLLGVFVAGFRARGDGTVAGQLRQIELQLRQLLGYPTGLVQKSQRERQVFMPTPRTVPRSVDFSEHSRSSVGVGVHPLSRKRPDRLQKPSASLERSILAATDFSDASTGALDCAAALAGQADAALLLFRAMEPILVPPLLTADMVATEEERMARVSCAGTTTDGPVVSIGIVRTMVTLGRPADSIAAVADDQWFGARPGSIAYGVLSPASTAVLVVPSRPASNREAS